MLNLKNLSPRQKGIAVGVGVVFVGLIGVLVYFVFIKKDTPKPISTTKPISTNPPSTNPPSTTNPSGTNSPLKRTQTEAERVDEAEERHLN